METREAALQGGGAGVSAQIWNGGTQIWEEPSPPHPHHPRRDGQEARLASRQRQQKELIRLAINGETKDGDRSHDPVDEQDAAPRPARGAAAAASAAAVSAAAA